VYAVRLFTCSRCHGTHLVKEADMPKITRAGGATNAAAGTGSPEPVPAVGYRMVSEHGPELVDLPEKEEVASSPGSSSSTSPEKPSKNAEPKKPARQRRARTTGSRSSTDRTAGSTAGTADGGPTGPTSATDGTDTG
jgi:hypothetical protein